MSLEEEKVSSDSTSATLRVRAISALDLEVDHTHPEMQRQIDELKSTINSLILEVNSIRNLVEVSPVRVRIVETREVPIQEVKKMIMEYMQSHETAYPDDIADELGLDLKITVEAVNQLMKESKITEREE